MPTSQVARPMSTIESQGLNPIKGDPTLIEGITVPQRCIMLDRSNVVISATIDPSGSFSSLAGDCMPGSVVSPASTSSESSTRVLHRFAEIARIWLLFGITMTNAINLQENHVIVRIVQDDIRLMEMLFPLCITLLGFSLCVNKNVAGNISRWTSLLAFWCCWTSVCTTRWTVLQLHRTSDAENPGAIALQHPRVLWRYLLGVHAPRALAVLCMVIATCAMILA